jgi:hypothetical protein
MGPEFEPQPDPYINSSALGADATAGDKRSSWVASVVNDKATRSLPNIIQSFRNSRLSTILDLH